MVKKFTRKPKRVYRRKRTYRKRKGAHTLKVGGASEIRSTATYKRLVSRPVAWRTVNGELPERVITKMRYNDAYINFLPAALVGTYTWRINSINQPDATGVNRPSLHDAFSTLYDKYKVTAASVKITYHNRSASRAIVGLLATDRVYSGSFTADIIKRSSNVSAIVDASTKDNETCTLSMYVDFKKLVGPKYHDSVYTSSFGANPSDMLFGYLAVASLDGANNVSGAVSSEITFYTELFENKFDRAIDHA